MFDDHVAELPTPTSVLLTGGSTAAPYTTSSSHLASSIGSPIHFDALELAMLWPTH